MSLGSFFKGTSHEQNSRFKDKEKKLINSRKWPDEFEQRVDFSKVFLKRISITTYFSGWAWHHQALDWEAYYWAVRLWGRRSQQPGLLYARVERTWDAHLPKEDAAQPHWYYVENSPIRFSWEELCSFHAGALATAFRCAITPRRYSKLIALTS